MNASLRPDPSAALRIKFTCLLLFGTMVACLGAKPAAASINVAIKDFEGTWSSTVSYSTGSVVTYDGASYIALTTSKNVKPTSSSKDWSVLGSPGATGKQGPAGPAGPKGPQGPQGPAGLAVGAFGRGGTVQPLNTINNGGSLIASTGAVAQTGTYLVNAAAIVAASTGDGIYCFVGALSNGGLDFDGISDGTTYTGYAQAAVVDALSLVAGDAAALYCESATGNTSSFVYGGSLTALLVQSVSLGAAQSPLEARNRARADSIHDPSPNAPPR